MNFKRTFIWVILIAAPVIFSSCEKEVILHDVETELPQLLTASNLPSFSACIVKDDTIVWSEFYGYSNKDNGTAADEETMYHIASISKLFIVTSIMQLEEQGKINLDEDVNTYLPFDLRHPDFPDVPITTRMLLTHAAGLSWPQSYDGEQGMWNQFEPDQSPPPGEWVPEFLIPSGQNYDPDLWKPVRPGAYEFYSNIGICIAACLLEEISGRNFREYCRDFIFTPLGMYSTSYNYADLDWDKIAVMYDNQGNGTTYFDNRVYAGGGVKSTLRDMGRFAMCIMNKGELYGQRILKESTVNKMLEIQNQASGLCLTWESFTGNWFGHTGGLVLGTASNFMIHPESKTAMIIFTNSHSGLILPGGDIYWLIKQKANEYIH